MTSDQQQAPTASITTPTDREIKIERVFDAPRDRVFAVYTDPELIPEWWGPRGTTAVVDQMDARPGGSWRFVIGVPSRGHETAFQRVTRVSGSLGRETLDTVLASWLKAAGPTSWLLRELPCPYRARDATSASRCWPWS
jgi:hypothetical protein